MMEQTTGGDMTSQSYLGLRRLIEDWEDEGIRLARERGAEEIKTNTPSTLAAIHSKYLDDAIREDRELVGRLTEALNIQLTFGGLLSAVITAFLLSVQSQLQSSPIDATNKMIMQLLQKLDGSITDLALNQEPPRNTVRVLSWWYASLAYSLASAFGALLAKQWVINYQSRPSWADTPEKLCQLRETRYQGLAKWRFFAVLDTLPVLLQTSLLLFSLGLADYVHPIPLLFSITLISIIAFAVCFTVTLVAGMLFPSCPYKSPFTHFTFRVAGAITVWILTLLLLALMLLALVVLLLVRGREAPVVRDLLQRIRNRCSVLVNYRLGRALEAEYGEQSLLWKDFTISPGALCGWIQRREAADGSSIRDLEVAAEAIISLPVDIATNAFRRRKAFGQWCNSVMHRLRNAPSNSSSCIAEADLLCHILHHIPEAIDTTKSIVLTDKKLNIYTTGAAMGYLARILRERVSSQGGPLVPGTVPWKYTRPPSLAVYLRCLLSHWCLVPPKDRPHCDSLLEELPVILQEGYLRNARYTAIIDSITLTAIGLIPDDILDIPPARSFLQCDPLEQLFLALHRLSYYSADQAPTPLLPTVIEAVREVLTDEKRRLRCSSCPSWKNGRLAESLFRLLRLGRSWWYLECAPWLDEAPGANLVYQVQTLLGFLSYRGITETPISRASSLFSTHLEDVFATFAHPAVSPPAPHPYSLSSLLLLDHALGIRHRHHMAWVFPSFLFRPIQLTSTSFSSLVSTSPVGLLQQSPQVVRRLRHILNDPEADHTHKEVAFSIVVKGRDIFFSPSLLSNSLLHEQVLRELDSLAGKFLRNGNVLEPLENKALESFVERWDALSGALGDLERSLSPVAHRVQKGAGEKMAGGGRSSLGHVKSSSGIDASPVIQELKFRSYSNSTGSSGGTYEGRPSIMSGLTSHIHRDTGHQSGVEDLNDRS